MSETVMLRAPAAPAPAASVEEIQRDWSGLTARVSQLEAEKNALEADNKALRFLLERLAEHRQKSHTELVLLLTTLVTKLPITDVGVIVSRLVEHNREVSHTLAGLVKGASDAELPPPEVLQTLEQTRRNLAEALKKVMEELVQSEPPFEGELLNTLCAEPELFFSPKVVRANRCFVKGQVPRERILREFGQEALVFFNDMTTDPKRNPRPKPDEIALGFKPDFEALFQQNPNLLPGKREALLGLYQRIQRAKAPTDQARAQKIAFQKMSFLLELVHYYNHQSTEAPEAIFAQRLPGLIEQLGLAGAQDKLDEKSLQMVEGLMAFVINLDLRQMLLNNVGKGNPAGTTLKFVLRLRSAEMATGDSDQVIVDFVKHLIPAGQKTPTSDTLAAVLRLTPAPMQRSVVKHIMVSERLRKPEAEALGKGVAAALGLKLEEIKVEETVSPEVERQRAWARIKELISGRMDPATITAAIRDRLHAKYDADEIRASWLTLIEADAISLIRVFCLLPYRPDGKTDAIAQPVMETYVSRLTHEKYAPTYTKVVNSLKNMFHAKPDSPTLLNFVALVRWISPDAASRLCHDVGMASG